MVPVAIAQMVSARGLAVMIGLGAMAALGRILTPSDFGTFAFAMAVFGVIKAVSEFGLIHFIVRQDEYSLDEVRSAVGLALALALGLSTITCAAVILVGGGSTGSRFALAAFLAGALVAGAVAMPHEARRQPTSTSACCPGLRSSRRAPTQGPRLRSPSSASVLRHWRQASSCLRRPEPSC